MGEARRMLQRGAGGLGDGRRGWQGECLCSRGPRDLFLSMSVVSGNSISIEICDVR